MQMYMVQAQSNQPVNGTQTPGQMPAMQMMMPGMFGMPQPQQTPKQDE
jgi:hypothetical protein